MIFNIKPIALLFFVYISMLVVGQQETGRVSDKSVSHSNIYFPVDWKHIDPDSKRVPKLAAIEGFLEFDGNGDFPRITLWQSDEARKQKKSFCNIVIQSESASPLIVGKFGKGVDSWKVLEGLFVSVEGNLEIEPNESRHIFIGIMKNVKLIEVKNNGMTLLEIK